MAIKVNLLLFDLFSLLSFFSCQAATKGSAVRALVYTDIAVSSFDKCIRVFNGTRQIGCQAALNGNVGVLFHINRTADIDKLTTGKHSPYIVVMHADVLSSHAVKRLHTTKKVVGVIVYSQDGYTGKLDGWSPEPKCPRYIYGLYNSQYGPKYSQCKNPWNPVGNELSEQDIEFPVFVMKNKTASKLILQCHDEHNLDQEYPLCAAQMNSFMDGAVSTETCIRRTNLQNNLSPATYCQLMGGHTLLATLQADESSEKPIILITAALDSRSFILNSNVPGANSLTGFATLLSVAEALGNLPLKDKSQMSHRVMFVLFDGEAFDNMGSARMVYDMSRQQFPFASKEGRFQPATFNLSQVAYVIEIGQVGLMDGEAWMHYDPISSLNIKNITDAFQEQSFNSSVKFRLQSEGLGLVPSSLQSILKERNVSGVVITDYDKAYKNKYYFSVYDTPDKLNISYNNSMTESEALPQFRSLADKLAHLANVIAKTVYKLATGGNMTNPPTIHTPLIARTLYCYYFNDTCSLFLQLLDSSLPAYKPGNSSVKRYVSVYNSGSMSTSSYMARSLLVRYTGDPLLNITEVDKCKSHLQNDDMYTYFAFKHNGSVLCYKSTVYTLDGRSPAAVISNYDYANGPYPAWSESQWGRDIFGLSVFLVQDSVSEGMVLFSGLLVLLLSIIIMFTVTRKSDMLFNSSDML